MTTFKTSDIVSFLEANNHAWAVEMFKEEFNDEQAEKNQVLRWFTFLHKLREDPSALFRKMEATIIQHTEL